MYIQNINITKENITIYYPTTYIPNQSNNFVNIRQIVLSGTQHLEKNNNIQLNTEAKFVLPIIQTN